MGLTRENIKNKLQTTTITRVSHGVDATELQSVGRADRNGFLCCFNTFNGTTTFLGTIISTHAIVRANFENDLLLEVSIIATDVNMILGNVDYFIACEFYADNRYNERYSLLSMLIGESPSERTLLLKKKNPLT